MIRIMEKAIKSRMVEGKIAITKISMNPRKNPARPAPKIDPLPPRIAATKAF